MHLSLTVTTILLAFIYPVQAHQHKTENSTTCKRTSSVEAFTALIVTQDPDIVEVFEMSGKAASDLLNPITSRRAVAKKDTLKLAQYFELTAYNVGGFLKQEGILDCKNAVSMALDYFRFAREEFEGLDMGKFEYYMQAVVQGMVYFLSEYDLELEFFAPSVVHRYGLPLVSRKRSFPCA